MKLIEIINKRCNCKVIHVVIKSKIGERVAYRNVCEDNSKEYIHRIHSGSMELEIKYSADKELSDEAVSLLTDLIDVYVENRAAWEIDEHVSKSPDIYAGRATLDEMVKVATNALVYSSLFDKAAVMFFNERLMELRGIYMIGIPPYTEEQVKAFRNKRVPVEQSIIKKLQEYNQYPDDIEMHLEYTNTHIFTTRSTARLLNTMMMAAISNQKYEYTTSFYKEIESEMRNKQSLVTLGNYVATIAHEVKNPLISIGGFAKRLMKAVTNEDLKRMAGIIAAESIRLEHLTEDILSFSRKRPPKKEKILLKKLFSEIKPLFETRMAEHNFKMNIDIPDDAYIYADIDQIKQVIVNLITNAMNVMENDGTVAVNFQEKDGKTNIMISDSGPGIPLEVMPNLFKPFFTTSNSGTGLGLPISRKILNNHNGDLTVYNSKNGAVFTIILPVE